MTDKEIQQLEDLHNAGSISEQEYQEKKQALADQGIMFSSSKMKQPGTSDPNVDVKELPQYVSNSKSSDPTTLLDGLTKICSLVGQPDNNEILSATVESGILPRLVSLLAPREHHLDIQYQALRCLMHLVSGPFVRAVKDAEAVPKLFPYLRAPDERLVETCLWALGNIAGDCPEFRDYLLSLGLMDQLASWFYSGSKKYGHMRAAAWVVSNLCRGKPAPNYALVSQAIPVMTHLIGWINDFEVKVHALWAIVFLSNGPENQIQDIIDRNKLVPYIIEILANDDIEITTPALRSLGNLTLGTDAQTDLLLEFKAVQEDLGLLESLKPYLQHSKPGMVSDASWLVSNIASGTTAQVQAIIDAQLFPMLVDISKNQANSVRGRTEAVWALANGVTHSTTAEQVTYFVQVNAIAGFRNGFLLGTPPPNRLVESVLDAVQRIILFAERDNNMERCKSTISEQFGLELLNEISNMHDNIQVKEKAQGIIKKLT